MGTSVGCKIATATHLHHKNDGCFISLLQAVAQLLHMLHPSLRRRIWEQHHTIFLQRNPLDLNKHFLGSSLQIKIEARSAMSAFRLQVGHLAKGFLPLQPLLYHLIGRLGIHVDKQGLLLPNPILYHLFHRNQVVFSFTLASGKILHINRGTGQQKLLAAPCILYVHNLLPSCYFHMGNKAIGACAEYSLHYLGILHSSPHEKSPTA